MVAPLLNRTLIAGILAALTFLPAYDFLEVCTLTLANTLTTFVLLHRGQAGEGHFSYSVIVNKTEKSV
ncbi:MAG TPA: hypothetical protein VNL36_02860 [Bacteroidota bacterium]|nr:hypothetical protein [Bacteroidota bacterium]